MNKPRESFRLQPSLEAAAQRMAAADGASLSQFINVAVAEKLSALETEVFLQTRASKGRREGFLSFLDGAGEEPPCEGDQLL